LFQYEEEGKYKMSNAILAKPNTITKLSNDYAPVALSNRIDALDIIRGFALIGILLMNIEWFNRPLVELSNFDVSLGGLDWASAWFVKVFVEGKFWKLFTLLFGMGFAIMLIKAQENDRPFGAWFIRRMTFLFIIGLFHMIFLWGGDILHQYAIGGLMLLAWIFILRANVMKKFDTPKVFLIIGLAMTILPLIAALFFATFKGLTVDKKHMEDNWQQKQLSKRLMTEFIDAQTINIRTIAPNKAISADLDKEAIEKHNTKAKRSADEVAAFTQGSYWVATKYRIEVAKERIKMAPIGTFFVGVPILLIGYWLIASGVMRQPERHRVFFKWLTFLGLGFGLFLSTTGTMINLHPASESAEQLKFISQGLFSLGKDVLAAGYLGSLVLLITNNKSRQFLLWLAPMGRMALTNYIAHSLILSSIFYGYAGGMFGEIARAEQMFLVVVVIVFQAIYSRIWLNHFQFGPLEWLWRSATYLKLQPLVIVKAKSLV